MLKKCETCGTVFESIESTTGDKGAPAVCPKCDLKKAMGDDTPDGVSTPQKPARKSLFKRLVAFDFFGLLKNPLIIIMSIAGGILFGLFKSQTALMLKPIGEVYLSLLKMCVLPILITRHYFQRGQTVHFQGSQHLHRQDHHRLHGHAHLDRPDCHGVRVHRTALAAA